MEIRYKIETLTVGSWQFKLKRVQNLDDLIDTISDEEFNKDERLPYWAELWPSALGLSTFLSRHPQLIQGQTVLELGIGLGLTSLVLQRLAPRRLVLTDYEPLALDLTRENFVLNDMPPPTLQIMDWRHPAFEELFTRIVASDILYEERFFKPLINLFSSCVHPQGKIILAEPNRAVARSFFAQLNDLGFHWQKDTVLVPEHPKPIRVTNYVITLPPKR